MQVALLIAWLVVGTRALEWNLSRSVDGLGDVEMGKSRVTSYLDIEPSCFLHVHFYCLPCRFFRLARGTMISISNENTTRAPLETRKLPDVGLHYP